MERKFWVVPLSAAVIVLLHVSLSGMTGVWAFGRLSVVAWPFALLALVGAVPALTRPPAAAIVCVGLGIYSTIFSLERIPIAVSAQVRNQSFLSDKARGLQSDEPDWFDFRRKRFSQPQRGSEHR